jgi:hypothetical protein
MLRRSGWLMVLFLAFGSWAFAQQSSNLVGTWVGKVQGFGVEMRLVLNADGSADYEGVVGSWRAQGNRLLLTQEGETVAYNYALQGSQLTLSGGDLMAPMVMMRTGGGGRLDRAPATRAAPQPSGGRRALSEAEVANLLEGGVPSRRIIELVEERGIAFPVTSASVSRLKAKGAANALIGALQQAEDRGGGEMAAASSQQNPLQSPPASGP